MKKIKTNLPGLDPLLHGGLQIDSLTGPGDSKSSLVIVLRGKKGVSKHLFAMQLMHGIARSLGERHKGKEPKAIYYSINKNTDKLNDSYIDFLIAEWLTFMTQQSRKEKLGFGPKESGNTVRNDKQMIYEILFDSKLEKEGAYEELCAERQTMFKEYGSKIIDFLSDNILLYNPRTNSLHFRRPYMGDGPRNLWAVRNCDSVLDYYKKYGEKFNSLKSGGVIARHFLEMFIKVDFNAHLYKEGLREKTESKYGDIGNMERYSKTANVTYEQIVDHMEHLLNEIRLKKESKRETYGHKWSDYELRGISNENESATKNDLEYDVLVVDGFSQFDDDHLKNLQFSHLHKVARKLARVTILVLDDREEALCDGDVIIDLKKNEDQHQEYTYHELQIVKSSFQEVANGWHQYKVQPDGIKVFPSIHFLLSKRYYMKSKTHEIGQGVFEDSFEEYLDSKLHIANGNPCDHLEVEGFFYKEYNENRRPDHSERFMKILANHRAWGREILNYKSEQQQRDPSYLNRFLSKVILADEELSVIKNKCCSDLAEIHLPRRGFDRHLTDHYESTVIKTCNGCNAKCCSRDISTDEINGWDRRYPTSVIVGNPNSFKRRMALGKAYHWARKKEHVLIVLFGKNDDTLRKQLICPALQRAACADKSQEIVTIASSIARRYYPDRPIAEKPGDHEIQIKDNYTDHIFDESVYNICSECEKYIHFFRIRMGCIAAEEIFFRLEEQIRIYSNEDANTGIEKRRLHIIIDDLQRADYGFPFLGDTSLFTAALINLCHEHKAELTMLCDKHSSRTKEVCALADNVIVMDRKKEDLNSVHLYIEKCVDFPAPGAIMEFNIGDVLNLFQCACINNTYKTPSVPFPQTSETSSQKSKGEDGTEKKDIGDTNPGPAEDSNESTPTKNSPVTGEGNDREAQKPLSPGLTIDFSRISCASLCGSMRDFWRNTQNAVLRNDEKTSLSVEMKDDVGGTNKDGK